jgi:hypothetical protein
MVNEKSFLTKSFLNLTAISVLIFIVGCIIVNIHLHTYNLVDYDLIKPRAISVGTVCVFIFIIHVTSPIVKYSILCHKDSILMRGLFILSNASFFTLLLFTVLVPEILFNPSILKQKGEWYFVFGNKAFMFVILYLSIGSIIFTFPPKRKWLKRVIVVLNYLTIFAIVFIISLYIEYENMRNILFFEAFVLSIPITMYVMRPLIDRYKPKKFTDSLDEELAMVKENSNVEVVKAFLNKKKFFLLGFLMVLIVIMGLILVSFYARKIYPLLPQQYGGGKLEKVMYIVQGKKEVGLKVHETSEYVFIQKEDKRIKKLEWEKIEEILPFVSE